MPDKKFRERVLDFANELEHHKLTDPKWRDSLKLLTTTSRATLLPAYPAIDRLGVSCERRQKMFVLAGDGRTNREGERRFGLRDRLCGARESAGFEYNTYMVGDPVVTVTARGSRPIIMTAEWDLTVAGSQSWQYAGDDGLLFETAPSETCFPIVDEIVLTIRSFGSGGGAEGQAGFSWMAVVPAMRLYPIPG